MTDKASTAGKTAALLEFLRDTATLRRKRIPTYGASEKLLWLADLPRALPPTWKDACRSAFVAENPAEIPDLWLEVRKKRKPTLPALPTQLRDWVPQEFQTQPDDYLDKNSANFLDLLNPEITVLVEKRIPDPNAPPSEGWTLAEKVP
jgi:hypothetical protein